MKQIKPQIQHSSVCPYCGNVLQSRRMLWQGIHTCVVSSCENCKAEIVEDLAVGHAIFNTYQVNIATREIFGPQNAAPWFGQPLLQSLLNPDTEFPLEFEIEKKRDISKAIILNCIDFLYGHALLKLLNAERYANVAGMGLVVIVPRFLRWMVPAYVAEIWTVNIPLGKAQHYFPALHAEIEKQLARFDTVFCSLAHSHPKHLDIKNFTGVGTHDFDTENYRITYIWREDRFWWGNGLTLKILNRLGWRWPVLWIQKQKVAKLFSALRKDRPQTRFTVAGLGRTTRFPDWIEDCRVNEFTSRSEQDSCRIYSESRLVIGVHGSSMLLPSGHAGMTMDLMPVDRWGNLAQDVIYQPGTAKADDERIVSWRYRYIPTATSVGTVASICKSMIENFQRAAQLYLSASDTTCQLQVLD